MGFSEQNLLNHWYNEYHNGSGGGAAPVFKGYTKDGMGNKTMGLTRYRSEGGKRYGEIVLYPTLEDHRRLMEAVLWHEACHALLWSDMGYTGHGAEFKKLLKSRRRLYYLDLLAGFLCPFMR